MLKTQGVIIPRATSAVAIAMSFRLGVEWWHAHKDKRQHMHQLAVSCTLLPDGGTRLASRAPFIANCWVDNWPSLRYM